MSIAVQIRTKMLKILKYSLGSTTVWESSVLVVDDGVDVASGLLELYVFGVEMSSRPISRSRVLLNSLETS